MKVNIPKKGAGRKWSARLKEIGQRKPPEDFLKEIVNSNHQKKKSASSIRSSELDAE